MDDQTTETLQQVRNRRNERRAQRLLNRSDLHLDEDSISWILKHIDCFVSQSGGNVSVTRVYFYQYRFNGQDDALWEKLGQAIGNLQALDRLHTDNDPDWQILKVILSHVRQRITLRVAHVTAWRAEESRSFARAIHGQTNIRIFAGVGMFPFESMDAVYSALATLPALDSIILSNRGLDTIPGDESTLANPESLTKLLRVPSLQSVSFDCFFLTPALCQAISSAFMEGTAITKLKFRDYSFSADACAAIMPSGLSRNTSVRCIRVAPNHDATETHYSVLATAVPSSSTLQELTFEVISSNEDPATHVDWSPILLTFGKKTGPKALSMDMYNSMDESLCTAMQNGLGMNETIEILELNRVPMCEDTAALWCRALSFLRTTRLSSP
jgi:hypothetical protein